MAASLISVLVGSILAERFGVRRIFFFGAILSAVGIAGHLAAQGFATILLSRSLTGFGYGLVYAAAQIYINQHAKLDRRSSGFSVFFAVIVSAEICGPALGGVLADRLGLASALVAATVVAAISAVLCMLFISRLVPELTDASGTPENAAEQDAEGQIEGHAPSLRWDAFRTVLLNPRFMVQKGALWTRLALRISCTPGQAARATLLFASSVFGGQRAINSSFRVDPGRGH